MIRALRILAGRRAAAHIRSHGLQPADIAAVIGASGGPKWLCLAGLDSAVLGDFLPRTLHTIPLIGSSIGAWRMALAAHPDPAQAIAAFQAAYPKFTYQKSHTAQDITDNSYKILDEVLGAAGRQAIIENQRRPLSIFTVKGRGLAGSSRLPIEMVGLMGAFLANLIARPALQHFYRRVIFQSGLQPGTTTPALPVGGDFGTIFVPLSADNLNDAVMASGSIPVVVSPVQSPKSAPPGLYRDGGITDYHFEPLPLQRAAGAAGRLLLYPHFYPHLVPGWFDKRLRSRWRDPRQYDDLLLLCPSDDLIARFPDSRIPDRSDFDAFGNEERETRWRHVIAETQALGDDFRALWQGKGDMIDRIETVD